MVDEIDPRNAPRIVSVDDHVIEPPDLWTARLPARHRDDAPRTIETWVTHVEWNDGYVYHESESGDEGRPADVWVYEDTRAFISPGQSWIDKVDEQDLHPLSYGHNMAKSAYEQAARLQAMDANNTEASLCFPSISRFCGQLFLNRHDRDLALACVRTYNDWMIDEWCGDDGRGRLLPVTMVPLWDAHLAADEVRRCAAKGSHAVTFSECPPNLGLPSLYSRYWDPFVAACDETDSVVNLHVGSSYAATKGSQ